ncbi:aurora kinase A- and ninein-interacting protein [Rhynchocyon petersi]
MRRRGPEEEACGVWLDAAELKKRKVQTHLIKPGTKMLTLFPGERKTKSSFTPRSAPPAGTRQTSISSFFTLQPGRASGGDQTSVLAHRKSQTYKESKKDAARPEHFLQGFRDDCVASPIATSTPADSMTAELSPQSLQEHSVPHSMEMSFLTVLALPDTPVSVGEKNGSLACTFAQDLKRSYLLDQNKGGGASSGDKEWFHRSKVKNCEDVENLPVGKCHQSMDKAKWERKAIAQENRQASLLHAYRDSWSGESKVSVKQNPHPVPVLLWDSEKREKDSWSPLFTEDSQGQRVIAHKSRTPFRDVTNDWNQDWEQYPESPNLQSQCQEGSTQLNLQPDLFFTQDSEGNQVIRHQF